MLLNNLGYSSSESYFYSYLNLLYNSSFSLIDSSNFFLSPALISLFNKGDTDFVADLTGGLDGVLYLISGIGLALN